MTKEKKKKRKENRLSSWLLVLLMLLGIGIMAYPTASDRWNAVHASRAIASYSSTVENTDKEKLAQMLEEAKQYNERLLEKENPYLMTDEALEEYTNLLDVSGTGIMGYLTIESIGVHIPIYHGMEEKILQIAVGHLDWTSLPVGGESTHAVLSGHRGLPSAKLFTDLDRMRVGDVFIITVLDQELRYEVDQIRVVEPDEVSDLVIVPGEDYCTLVTCTPYGINTHRLLIRGNRVSTEPGPRNELIVPSEAYRLPYYLTIPAVGIPLLFLFLIGVLIWPVHGKSGLKKSDLNRVIEELSESEKALETDSRKTESDQNHKNEDQS